ncbi:MAG TPA: HEAT repeat domain-containing protein [Candidatus Binatia bacterium]|nr:HEAT repeat domain-containing protein [Candidatus Binatia bacterium]
MAPKDVARLWEELRHRDPEEKIDWIRQLAKDPTPDAVEVLLDALEQESWFLRDQAAHALASLGEIVLGPLVERLDSGLWYTRAAAAAALGRMGAPESAPALAATLRDPNRTVRDAAWDALSALSRSDLAAHSVADAIAALPERARRFALDGLYARDDQAADRVAALIADPALRAAAERAGLAQAAGDDDGLSWLDVVGNDPEPRSAR